MIHPKKRYVEIILFSLYLFVLWSCAAATHTKKDPFFDKWQSAAAESQGHSPSAQQRVTILPGMTNEKEPKAALAPEKEKPQVLSDTRVTLTMRQADVKAVIRAMARAAGKNILIKNDIKGDISVSFSDVPWDEAFKSILQAQGLSYVFEGNIIRILSLEDMEQSLKMEAALEKKKTMALEGKRAEPLATFLINVDYADPEALRDILLDFLTKEKDGKPYGSIKVDKHSRSLIIQAIKEDLAKITPIIEKIDKPTHQINIKANIVETTKGIARNLGIQWGGMYGGRTGNHSYYVTPGGTGGSATSPLGPLNGNYTPTSAGTQTSSGTGTGSTTNPSIGLGIAGQGFGVNFPAQGMDATASASLGLIFGTIGGNVLEAQLSALQNDNKLNILSSPSITTLDNQTAYTENGEKIPYVTTSTSGSGAGTTQTVNFENAVLRLEITPHVIDGKNLKMNILVKKDEVDTSHTVQGNPFIIKKQTETTLIVQDGETIVISGLSKQTNAENVSGVPWLKDIPLLGWLFKSQGRDEQKQEVLIFITPRILPPAALAKAEVPEREGNGNAIP